MLAGLLALVLGAQFIIWCPTNTLGTLESWYADHLRHLRHTPGFPVRGFAIYFTPRRELAGLGDERAYIWLDSPHLYPPGSLLL